MIQFLAGTLTRKSVYSLAIVLLFYIVIVTIKSLQIEDNPFKTSRNNTHSYTVVVSTVKMSTSTNYCEG
jgi:CHASE3 domain sensor protein